MDEYRFEEPWALALLVVVPVVLLLAWPYRRGVAGSVPIGRLGAAAAATWRVRLEPALMLLRLVALAALVVALARPQRGEASTEI
jgi:Ca-activated chloride channel homolog